jgi:uncharacterized protein (TIGR02246 family)
MSRRLKPPPQAALLLASADDVEAQFYEALQRGDLDRLMAVWIDDEEIVCVHPGGVRVVGPAAIRASFEAIFANGGVPVTPTQVRRLTAPGAVVHHLVERVPVPEAAGGPRQQAWMLATNVYVSTALGWRMAAHHVSPGRVEPPTVAAERPSILH